MKKTTKLVQGFGITLLLSIVSLFLNWISNPLFSENGFEQEVQFLVVPFFVITGLSLLLLFNKKVIHILFSIVAFIVSGILLALLLTVKSEMGPFDGSLGIGFYVMVCASIGNLALSVNTLVQGFKLKVIATV